MIYYEAGGLYIVFNLFRCSGTVFKTALIIAAPCAAVSSLLYHYFPSGSLSLSSSEEGILKETQAWGGFSFLVGFLIVFRTSQAYNRFWEGVSSTYRMRAEWFDAIMSIITFTKHSQAPKDEISRFKELLVRLASMLHAAALAELEAGKKNTGVLWAHSYDILDPAGIDTPSIETIKECEARTELLFGWVQQLIVENINTGILSIPPPILSRAFQELANGMVAFHDAMRISYLPFPFPYAQACDCVLILHWLLAPLVTAQWVTSAFWAGIFCFVQVFILWSLNLIAIEIDHPFGLDYNDMDCDRMQEEMNEHFVLMVSSKLERTPRLSTNMVNIKCPRPNDGSTSSLIEPAVPKKKVRPSTMRELFRFVSEGNESFKHVSSSSNSLTPSSGSCPHSYRICHITSSGNNSSVGKTSASAEYLSRLKSRSRSGVSADSGRRSGTISLTVESIQRDRHLEPVIESFGSRGLSGSQSMHSCRLGLGSQQRSITDTARLGCPNTSSWSCPNCRHILLARQPDGKANKQSCYNCDGAPPVFNCTDCNGRFCRTCAISALRDQVDGLHSNLSDDPAPENQAFLSEFSSVARLSGSVSTAQITATHSLGVLNI